MNRENGPISLLVVEDNPSDVALITGLLSDVDEPRFAVRQSSYLRDALVLIEESPPDVVLLDLGLPDAVGLEALKKLRTRGELPLVVLTGNVDDELAIDSLRYGAQDYLVKENLDSDRLVRGLRYAIERKRAEMEMNSLREDVAQLANRQQRWVAQELHDGLGQHLTGLGMMAKSLQRQLTSDGSSRAAFAQELSELIGEAQQIVRRLIRGVDPVDLSAGGLQQALENLARATFQQCGIECAWKCPEAVLVDNHDVALQLYRIAQEAVHNAVKHARAEAIEIGLCWEKGRLLLEVADRGCGFSAEQSTADGRGSRIMQYRAETIRGKLEVVSATGRGTVIRCSVPADVVSAEQRSAELLGNGNA